MNKTFVIIRMIEYFKKQETRYLNFDKWRNQAWR